jgi:Flp pilus assembly protein TadG
VVSVELAIALPLLLLLLLSIAEIGLMVADSLALSNACQEATRAAAIGKATGEVRAVVTASLPASVVVNAQDIILERRSVLNGVWSAWTALGDTISGGVVINDAASGNQVRVSLACQHHLLSGLVLRGANQNGTITLRTASVMLRY